MYVALPEMTASKVLNLARCVTSSVSSLDENDLSKIAQRLGYFSEVS